MAFKSKHSKVLAVGVPLRSKTLRIKKKGLYKRKPVSKDQPKKELELTKTKTFGKGKRTVPNFPIPGFKIEESLKRKITRKTARPSHLRSSIVQGRVAIVLAGRYKGKRVVVLGQLPSGLVLVTGPFKLNGHPLRRIPQTYLLATSTKIELSVDVSSIKDDLFKKSSTKKQSNEAAFFEDKLPEKTLSDEYVKLTKDIDTKVVEAVKKVPSLSHYLKSYFFLGKKDFPHRMHF
eukprot:NODE_1072_length_1468_cov_0.143901.p1 type:complete len:233 gc:universal NODE_1072_length_1468_cov_0.143901:573-1271(+)